MREGAKKGGSPSAPSLQSCYYALSEQPLSALTGTRRLGAVELSVSIQFPSSSRAMILALGGSPDGLLMLNPYAAVRRV